jgi:hypothetical protein
VQLNFSVPLLSIRWLAGWQQRRQNRGALWDAAGADAVLGEVGDRSMNYETHFLPLHRCSLAETRALQEGGRGEATKAAASAAVEVPLFHTGVIAGLAARHQCTEASRMQRRQSEAATARLFRATSFRTGE